MASKKDPGAKVPGSRSLDLDKARAARAEAAGAPASIVFGGKTFTLPVEMPMTFVWALEDGETRRALNALLGDQFEAFAALGPSDDDIVEIYNGIHSAYGVDPGEESASPTS